MKRITLKKLVMILAFLFFMAACGGGGGGGGGTESKLPKITASQSSIDYGGVVIENSADQTVVIKNTGTADLAIGNITKPNLPFIISSETCSNTTLKPAKSCNVNINFSPTSQGSYASAFSVPSNDSNSPSVKINIKGNGNGINTWINQVNTGTCPGPVISVAATVNDPKETVDLTALTTANFTLSENGIVVDPAKISLTNLELSPVSVVLALDWSESVTQITSTIGTAAKYFIDQLKLTDEAAIWKFNNVIEYIPKSTSFISADVSGKAELKTFIDSILAVDPGTKLYDSVFQSIDRAAQGINSKRVVIVLSDGVEAPGSILSVIKTVDQVIENAKLKGISVFTIYYTDPTFNGGNWGSPQLLQRLAKETGGQYYSSTSADLASIFLQISNVLSHNYTLTYKSTSSCNEALTLGVKVDYSGLLGETTQIINLP